MDRDYLTIPYRITVSVQGVPKEAIPWNPEELATQARTLLAKETVLIFESAKAESGAHGVDWSVTFRTAVPARDL
jgi:hypothetical protein